MNENRSTALANMVKSRNRRITELQRTIDAQEETIRRLRDALKPFAEVGDVITHADEKCVLEVDNRAKVVFVYGGDFRNAKRVYEEKSND